MDTEGLLVGLCPPWVRFWLQVFTVMDLARLFSSWVPSLLTGVGWLRCARLWSDCQGPGCRGCSGISGARRLLTESPGGRRQAADKRTDLVAQMVKNLPTMWKTWVQSLSWEDPLEKGMATYSRILAWRIPWTEGPDGLHSLWGPTLYSTRGRHAKSCEGKLNQDKGLVREQQIRTAALWAEMGFPRGHGGQEVEWPPDWGPLCAGRELSALQKPQGLGKASKTCLMGWLTRGDQMVHLRNLASFLAQHSVQEKSSFYHY